MSRCDAIKAGARRGLPQLDVRHAFVAGPVVMAGLFFYRLMVGFDVLVLENRIPRRVTASSKHFPCQYLYIRDNRYLAVYGAVI
jgi:hypothetical protein